MIRTMDILVELGRGISAKPVQWCKGLYNKIRTIWEGHRPWGYYKVLENTSHRKVKTIHVTPGKRLSLQKHRHRSEYWLVAEGCGLVEVNDKELLLEPGNSIAIPQDTTHRVTNVGKEPLVFVEIQVGDYLEEDDIIRLEDDYGRRTAETQKSQI
ncbi:phosphomannose isomerase type II C-terminal cupin domain [Paremcibacter congregatus]|nr:phosphomannose isomerase type II C-terminal cupin domain [Paremcibacter congregatus]